METAPEKVQMVKADNPFSLEYSAHNSTIANFRKKFKQGPKQSFASGILRVAVLDTCNMNCSYCYNEGMFDIQKKRISPQDLEIILEAASPHIKKIKLVGGEPLIHPEIMQLMRVSKQHAPTTITTNGVLLKRYARDIARLGLDGITISLDNLNPDSFRTLTRTSQYMYNQVLQGINALVDSGYNKEQLQLNVVVSAQNFGTLQQIIDFAGKRGLGRVNLLGLIKLDSIRDTDIISPEKIEAWLNKIGNKSEYATTTRRRYFIGKTTVDMVWQYCTVGCDVCRVDGFIRVTPSYEFKYCIADGAGVPFGKELKARNVAGVRARLEEATKIMGSYAPYAAQVQTEQFIPLQLVRPSVSNAAT